MFSIITLSFPFISLSVRRLTSIFVVIISCSWWFQKFSITLSLHYAYVSPSFFLSHTYTIIISKDIHSILHLSCILLHTSPIVHFATQFKWDDHQSSPRNVFVSPPQPILSSNTSSAISFASQWTTTTLTSRFLQVSLIFFNAKLYHFYIFSFLLNIVRLVIFLLISLYDLILPFLSAVSTLPSLV